MNHTVTLDADQVDLIRWALSDYVVRQGDCAAVRLRLDYGMDVPDMDVGMLVAACADALYTLCQTPGSAVSGMAELAALDRAEADALGPDGWWFR